PRACSAWRSRGLARAHPDASDGDGQGRSPPLRAPRPSRVCCRPRKARSMPTLRYRLLKAGDTLAYLGLIWLSWRFVDGELHWRLAIGAAALSGAWLALTGLRMDRLFTTYFDVLSRLEVVLPSAFGLALSLFALARTEHAAVRAIAAVELAGWVLLV